MASITTKRNGNKILRFYLADGRRKTISLGRCSRRDAGRIATYIERVLSKRRLGLPLDGQTAEWLASISAGLRGKLAGAGLVDYRPTEPLGDYLTRWLGRREHYKVTTRDAWSRVVNDLVGFFGAARPVTVITQTDAERFRQHLIDRGLSPTTIQKRLQHARLFFRDAEHEGVLPANPFKHVRHKGARSADRRVYITPEDAERLIRQCPDATWRLLVTLARFTGLRTPSEPFSLRWSDILWDEDRFIVRSPKTGDRAVPLFPRVRDALAAAFEVAPEGATHVFPENMRQRAEGPRGLRGANLRTQLIRMIKQAGLKLWPRVWHNLRASCETDLVREYPLPAVARWLGNTPLIAMRHYVDVTDSDFRRASRAPIGAPVRAGNEPQTVATPDGDMQKTSDFTRVCEPVRVNARPASGG